MIKELLKRDFGLDLDIAGGTGQSRNDPIHVLTLSDKDASRTEFLVLRGLGKGRRILWRTINIDYIPGMDVIQRKIETKEVTETEIITQVENYYFLRKNITSFSSKSLGHYVVFDDKNIGVAYPYELSWLHYDSFTDYSLQDRKDLGYSIAYNAPGIKVTIYVYPKVISDLQTNILELELEAAKAEIKSIYGSDTIEHEWEAIKNYDHIYYYFISKHAPEETSLIVIMRKKDHFLKLRCSFVDEEFMREVSSDFNKSFISLMREKDA